MPSAPKRIMRPAAFRPLDCESVLVVEFSGANYLESSRFFCQRLKRFAFCLGVRAFVSPPIGEALASRALDGLIGAFRIGDAKG